MFCNRRHSHTTGMTSNYSRSFGRSQAVVAWGMLKLEMSKGTTRLEVDSKLTTTIL